MLTPADIAAITFEPTRFRIGYDPAEVDAFIDVLRGNEPAGRSRRSAHVAPAAALSPQPPLPPTEEDEPVTPSANPSDRLEPAADIQHVSAVMTIAGLGANEIDAVKFHATRLFRPYDMAAVDELLDAVTAALRDGTDPAEHLRRIDLPPAEKKGYRRRDVDRLLSRLTSKA